MAQERGSNVPWESSQHARALAPGCAVRRAITAATVTGDPIIAARGLQKPHPDPIYRVRSPPSLMAPRGSRHVGLDRLPRGRERGGGGGEGGRDAAARGRERSRGVEACGRAADGGEDGPGGGTSPRHGWLGFRRRGQMGGGGGDGGGGRRIGERSRGPILRPLGPPVVRNGLC